MTTSVVGMSKRHEARLIRPVTNVETNNVVPTLVTGLIRPVTNVGTNVMTL